MPPLRKQQEKERYNGHKQKDMRGRLDKLLFNKDMADVEFTITKGVREPVKVYAHSIFLSIASDVFFPMFNDERFTAATWNEGRRLHEIAIEDIELEAFKSLLRFLYTDHIQKVKHGKEELSVSDAAEMLYAAIKYNIQPLVKLCVRQLEASIEAKSDDAEHIFDIIMIASGYEFKKMLDKCKRILVGHEEFIDHPSFLSMEKDSMAIVVEYIWSFSSNPAHVFKRIVEFGADKLTKSNKPVTEEALKKYLKDVLEKLRIEMFAMAMYFDQAFYFQYGGILTEEQREVVMKNLMGPEVDMKPKNRSHDLYMNADPFDDDDYMHLYGLPAGFGARPSTSRAQGRARDAYQYQGAVYQALPQPHPPPHAHANFAAYGNGVNNGFGVPANNGFGAPAIGPGRGGAFQRRLVRGGRGGGLGSFGNQGFGNP